MGSPDTRLLPEKVIAVDTALGAAGIPHSIGGAIALGYYGRPRKTADIDVNVFVAPEGWPEVRAALAPLGADVDADVSALEHDGEVRLPWDGGDVHVFFSVDALHDEMEAAARQVAYAGATIPVISPEHLVVRKATLGRPKDWIDVEQILIATEPLDGAEITGWLERLVGPTDPRLEKLLDLLRRRSIPT